MAKIIYSNYEVELDPGELRMVEEALNGQKSDITLITLIKETKKKRTIQRNRLNLRNFVRLEGDEEEAPIE